jgi:hypothetical protein
VEEATAVIPATHRWPRRSPHNLLAGSPAIDAISVNVACVDERGNRLTADQRGAPREQGTQCDVGAYEFDAVVP